jgi:hypothetical protein
MKRRPLARSKGATPQKPYCFVSYSTGEPTSNLLTLLIWAVFNSEYEIRLTPSALQSDSSQLGQIESHIAGCAFAVVCLDGLRPNVIHEYGHIRGCRKPAISIKKEHATVDVLSIIGASATPDLKLANPRFDVNTHLSNLKDIYHATWFPQDALKSARILWDEYKKLRKENNNLTEVKEPLLW